MKPPCSEQLNPVQSNAEHQGPRDAEPSSKSEAQKVVPQMDAEILREQVVNERSDKVKETSEKGEMGGKRDQSEGEPKISKGNNPKIKQPGKWMQDEHERFVKGNWFITYSH